MTLSDDTIEGLRHYQGTFNSEIVKVMTDILGQETLSSVEDRRMRFVEEALELGQASGVTEAEAITLVRYVYSRPKGECAQEVGGAMLTLVCLCEASNIDLVNATAQELGRALANADKIREKDKTKRTMLDTLKGLQLNILKAFKQGDWRTKDDNTVPYFSMEYLKACVNLAMGKTLTADDLPEPFDHEHEHPKEEK